MPITNFLSLADVYNQSDRMAAAQQERQLRDYQLADLERTRREQIDLEAIAKANVTPEGLPDYERIGQEAARMGHWRKGMEIGREAQAMKAGAYKLTEQQAEIMGRLAVGPKNDMEYQKILTDFAQIDAKAAATLREKFPVWSPESAEMIKLIGKQGMTAYQRESLRVQEISNRAKADRANDFKPSDANALKAGIAELLGITWTRDPQTGDVTISTLDPDKQRKFIDSLNLATDYFLEDPRAKGVHTRAYTRAVEEVLGFKPRKSTGTAPTPAGAPSGLKQVPASQQEDLRRKWTVPANRQRIMEELERQGYDASFLTGTQGRGGVSLPESTVRSSASAKPLRSSYAPEPPRQPLTDLADWYQGTRGNVEDYYKR